MRSLLVLVPLLMLFRYVSDAAMPGLIVRGVYLATFGAVGWMLISGKAKARLSVETRWFLVSAITFGLLYSSIIIEDMNLAGGISRTTMLLLVGVPLAAVVIGAFTREQVRWDFPVCQTGLAMLGLAFFGFIAERIGLENVHGTNIEASGTEMMSRDRLGLTFIGGVVPSATFLAVAMSSLVPALFRGRRSTRVMIGIGLLFCASLVVLTGTRGALTMVLIVSMMIGFGFTRRMRERPMVSAVVGLCLVVLIPGLYAKIFPFLDSLEVNLALEPLRRESQSSVFDLTGRVDAWDRSLDYLTDPRNLLLGYGAEGEMAAGLSAELASLPHPAFAGRDDVHAHNLVYNLLFMGGLVAVVPYFVMMIIAIKRALVNSTDLRVKSLLGMLLAWVGIGMHESLFWPHIYFFYFVLFGILAELFVATPEPVRQPAKAPVLAAKRAEIAKLPVGATSSVAS